MHVCISWVRGYFIPESVLKLRLAGYNSFSQNPDVSMATKKNGALFLCSDGAILNQWFKRQTFYIRVLSHWCTQRNIYLQTCTIIVEFDQYTSDERYKLNYLLSCRYINCHKKGLTATNVLVKYTASMITPVIANHVLAPTNEELVTYESIIINLALSLRSFNV